MLKLFSSLVIPGTLLCSVPALAEDTPPPGAPRVSLQAAPPPGALRPLPSREPKSRDAVTGGIVLVASGVTAIVIGTQLTLASEDACRGDFNILPSGALSNIAPDCTN